MNLSVEHVLMIVLVAFALHYFMGNCGCRVEGIDTSKRQLNECCDIDGSHDCDESQDLVCNFRDPWTSGCNHGWDHQFFYGRCDKKTHPLDDIANFIAPNNKNEGDCCHWGECKVGLECDSSGSSLLGGKCSGGWSGICKRPGRISPPSGAGLGGR